MIGWSVRCNKRFDMSERKKRQYLLQWWYVWCVVCVRSGWDIAGGRGRGGCHMACCGWDSQICWGFSFHWLFHNWTLSYILTCSDIVYCLFTFEEYFAFTIWVHNKGHGGQRYEEIRVNFALEFNKAYLTEMILHKKKKKTFLTNSMLDVIK